MFTYLSVAFPSAAALFDSGVVEAFENDLYGSQLSSICLCYIMLHIISRITNIATIS